MRKIEVAEFICNYAYEEQDEWQIELEENVTEGTRYFSLVLGDKLAVYPK